MNFADRSGLNGIKTPTALFLFGYFEKRDYLTEGAKHPTSHQLIEIKRNITESLCYVQNLIFCCCCDENMLDTKGEKRTKINVIREIRRFNVSVFVN